MIVGTENKIQMQIHCHKNQNAVSSTVESNQKHTYAGIDNPKSSYTINTQSGINNGTIVIAWSHFRCAGRMVDCECELFEKKIRMNQNRWILEWNGNKIEQH